MTSREVIRRSWIKRGAYVVLRFICRSACVLLFRIRCHGRHRMPTDGAVLVCSNHQSTLDPVLVGLSFNRRLNYLARRTLFEYRWLRPVIEFLDAIPLEREGLGIGGLKECLRRLRDGEAVLLFPEGTRTSDGLVAELHPGFVMLARRGNVSLLPVGIDGAFQAWPRMQKFPILTPIRVHIGEPLTPEAIARLDDQQLVALVSQRIRDCHTAAKTARNR